MPGSAIKLSFREGIFCSCRHSLSVLPSKRKPCAAKWCGLHCFGHYHHSGDGPRTTCGAWLPRRDAHVGPVVPWLACVPYSAHAVMLACRLRGCVHPMQGADFYVKQLGGPHRRQRSGAGAHGQTDQIPWAENSALEAARRLSWSRICRREVNTMCTALGRRCAAAGSRPGPLGAVASRPRLLLLPGPR